VEGALKRALDQVYYGHCSANTLIGQTGSGSIWYGHHRSGRHRSGGAGGLVEGIDRAGVKELAIGNFKVANAEVVVAHVSGDILLSKSTTESNAGVLGEEYLSSNFAVIDMGGVALYLRHPDSR